MIILHDLKIIFYTHTHTHIYTHVPKNLDRFKSISNFRNNFSYFHTMYVIYDLNSNMDFEKNIHVFLTIRP